MAVPHRRIGHEKPVLRRHPIRDCLRPLFVQYSLGSALAHGSADRRRFRLFELRRPFFACDDFGMTVHNDVGDVGKNPCPPVAPSLELEQFGSAVDEARRVFFRQEDRVLEERFDE